MKKAKLSCNVFVVILVLGVVAALLGPVVCQSVMEGFDQNEAVDRVSIAEGRGVVKNSPTVQVSKGRELAKIQGASPRDDSNVTTDPLALDEGDTLSRRRPQRCFDGPPDDVFGNCKPLCNAQSLVDSDGMVRQLSDIMECPEKDRSDTHMLCPSYDECTSGPWYKTLIPKSDRSSSTPADSGTKPSTPDPGPIDVPGRSHEDSWSGDSTYPSNAHFHGGTHHHHYHYDGGEHRRWRREVSPASPHLPTSVHGQQSLASQMSNISPDEKTQCSSSVTGAFSDCGPAAANIPCYELFNN